MTDTCTFMIQCTCTLHVAVVEEEFIACTCSFVVAEICLHVHVQ